MRALVDTRGGTKDQINFNLTGSRKGWEKFAETL